MDQPTERRKYPRFNFQVEVEISQKNECGSNDPASSRNISQGGVCIIVYERIKVSDILELEIRLPDEEMPVKVLGRVAWVKEFVIGDSKEGMRYDTGIEFMDLSAETAQKIEKYIYNSKEQTQ
jgi:c-di-GMP-binding flagellar brake protein YcgR